ncbi:MAG: hypothetical protein MJZ99_00340 [Bacteroidales bacterium]|nr:hypothetical protein [Bacteroidales bacterium]
MIITTTQQIEGYDIIEYLGLVGEQTTLETDEIYKVLEKLASNRGANAIIGLIVHPITEVSGTRYYTSSDTFGCYAYGTAVRIKQIETVLPQPPQDCLPKVNLIQPDLTEKAEPQKIMERWDMKINQWDMQE